MNFISIDFETANSDRGSACAIGIAVVEDSKLIDSKSYLLKPYNDYFDSFNIHIHGITPEMVKDSPTWEELWPEIAHYFNGTCLFAHNAGFDFSVLRRLFDFYKIEYPTFDYSCTLQLARQAIPESPSHQLDYLCDLLNIDLNHHDAESDAIACAKLVTHCLQQKGVASFEGISKGFDLKTGGFFPGGYRASLKTYPNNKWGGPNGTWQTHKISDIEFDASNADPDGPVYGASFCFTGTLESLARIDAQKIVLDNGGHCNTGVTKKTSYLVLGGQDYDKYGEGFVSSKTKKALRYAEEGTGVKIISEWEFMDML